MHPALLVKGADRLGARDFAARGPDGSERHPGIDSAHGHFDHLAAVVGFRDDAVGAALMIEADGLCRPFEWRHHAGYVIQNITVTVDAESGADDSTFIDRK